MIKHLLFCLLAVSVTAQNLQKPSQTTIDSAPIWAQMMYNDTPNVYAVDKAYKAYYRNHDFIKNTHTQYYKRWRRHLIGRILPDGTISQDEQALLQRQKNIITAKQNRAQLEGDWTLVGPTITHAIGGAVVNSQSNVYCIDQSLVNPNILYCGTESSEVYKSIDGGENWFNVSLDYVFGTGINYGWAGLEALEMHPTNPDIVYISAGRYIYQTTDGGTTWSEIYDYEGTGDLNAAEILVHPSQPNRLFLVGEKGVFRSLDGGAHWNRIFTDPAYDIQTNTADDSILYLLKKNSSQEICEFFISTDYGMNFYKQSSGWYNSTDPDRVALGGRIAVTEADPDRVYAYLIGQAKEGDNGYIGLYKSTDGGVSWTLPNGPAGGPYNDTHLNLANALPNGNGYHQGFYNCAIMASNTDPDQLLIGGINLLASDDGGASFYTLAGTGNGTPLNAIGFHTDMQDFRMLNGSAWITTDGGIYKSSDFFRSMNIEHKTQGIHSAEYWGFGSGWNEDVLYGGLYHNAAVVLYENYGLGHGLEMSGGGEPASGYVNPGQNTRIYSSLHEGDIIPQTIDGPVTAFEFGINPNESYFPFGSTELEFDPRCYSIGYTGKDNQLWKTVDKGISFSLLHTFGNNIDHSITEIEISRTDPNIMYVCQRNTDAQVGLLWITQDAGLSWNTVPLPDVYYSQNMILQVDPENPQHIWVAFEHAYVPMLVYKTTNGGANWTDLTTTTIQSERARSLSLIGGTDGGLYLFTDFSVFYRNNSMSDWIAFSDGLPLKTATNVARPFYRDGKIRTATYGKGIWESPFYEQPTAPIAQIMADKLVSTIAPCEDTHSFHFVDYSMLNHQNATWEWTFEGGTPATANTVEVDVTFEGEGPHLVTLTVTNASGQSDTDQLTVTTSVDGHVALPLEEGFEQAFPPPGFAIVNPSDDTYTWELNDAVGGFNDSNRSMYFRGYYANTVGSVDDAVIAVDLSDYENTELTFDVAYAIYSSNNYEGLEVLISTDCGLTYDSVYFKEGSELATAPPYTASVFVPSASEWRTEAIDISAYDGADNIQLIFRVIQGYGQHLYLDNIQLGGDTALSVETPTLASAALGLYPNPIRSGSSLFLHSTVETPITVELYAIDGKRIYKQQHHAKESIAIPNLQSGPYVYVLKTDTFIKNGKLIVH